MIKKILSNQIEDFKSVYDRLIAISHLTLYITDENLLNSTIKLLRDLYLLESEKQIEKPLYNVLKNLIYSKKDCTRIRAFVYSNLVLKEIKIKHLKDTFKGEFPELKFKIEGRDLYINSNEIDKVFKKNVIKYTVNEITGNLNTAIQENVFKKLIKSMAEIDYYNDTKYFKKDIEYLTILKESITAESIQTLNKRKKDYKKYLWFKLGVIIAKGGLNKYLLENKKGFKDNITPLLISKELGNIGFEKYILASVKEYKTDKDIYNSKNKMLKIVNHCKEKKINIDDDFISRIPLE
jgi:hypothetical protein